MSDGSLSQDEIDALLSGTEDVGGGESGGGGEGDMGDFDLGSLLGGDEGSAPAPSGKKKSKKGKEAMAPIDPNNLELLLNVEMKLTVELGRTKMSIKDILDIGEGKVIELDKLHGDPVDILVNDKVVARGEVVVVNEDFGIKVTELLDPTEIWPGFVGEG
jgi:flagellar motor switch protein FliN/FliY